MNRKAFTLIELIMVIVIIGILAAIALPKFVNLTGEAKQSATKGGLGAVRSVVAIEYARSATSTSGASFPATLNTSSFMGNAFPKNALNNQTNIAYVNATAGGTATDANHGWWYVTTGTATGTIGAYSDGTVNTSDW